MTESIETAPTMELKPPDIDRLVDELRAYHAIYSPLCQRREQREGAEKYLHGLLLEIPRKSIEPMGLALEGAHGTAVRTLQWFISAGTWGDETLLRRHGQEVDQEVGEDDGVLTLDGRDFLTQGQESVGVKRQYCGEVGKRANCQAGVFLGYASRQGYTLLERRRSLPHEWVEEETYAARRRRWGVPADLAFKTKPRWGWEMIQAVHQAGALRCRWVTCEEACGRDPAFRAQVAALGLWYCAEVPHDTQVWRQRPTTAVPAWVGRGRKPTRARVVEGALAAQTVVAGAAGLPAERWSRQTMKEGSKGPLVADCAAVRVIAMREGVPGPEVWLVLRRNTQTGELKTYVSNAPVDTPLATLVRLSGMRWPIETCCEDGKQYLGMGDYEGRRWRGWHHHMTLCLLAHGFLVRMRLRLKKKAPGLTLPQVQLLLIGMLPTRTFDAQWVLEVVAYWQQRNHAAYVSHRKRRRALRSQWG
jgi:SRSO17 transposase